MTPEDTAQLSRCELRFIVFDLLRRRPPVVEGLHSVKAERAWDGTASSQIFPSVADLGAVLEQLKAERAKLDRAIEALSGVVGRSGKGRAASVSSRPPQERESRRHSERDGRSSVPRKGSRRLPPEKLRITRLGAELLLCCSHASKFQWISIRSEFTGDGCKSGFRRLLLETTATSKIQDSTIKTVEK